MQQARRCRHLDEEHGQHQHLDAAQMRDLGVDVGEQVEGRAIARAAQVRPAAVRSDALDVQIAQEVQITAALGAARRSKELKK